MIDMKDIKNILLNKKIKNSDESRVLEIIDTYFPQYSLKRSNIKMNSGILSFLNISSALRVEILFKKRQIIEHSKKTGVHLRDII